MPSLRERLQQEKAAKTEARESDVAATKEQEFAALKDQFDSLLNKRNALSEIKEAAAEATAGVKGAKKALKAERQNLRSLHAESVADEDIEALPKPAELVRDEAFQDAEEVQSYASAREAFQLSTEKAKEVQRQLAELGIPDSDTLLPGQLELMLEEREKELNEESQAFILEHPEVNPEMAAKVREEIVSAKADALVRNGLRLGRSDVPNLFDRTLEKSPDKLSRAMHEAMQAFAKDGDDRTEALTALAQTFENPNSIGELDEQALSRAIVKAVADEFLFNETRFGSIESYRARRSDVFESRKAVNSEENLEELYTDKDGERVLDDARLIDHFISILENEPSVREAAQGIILNYKKLAEYRNIPKEVEASRERKLAIKDRLEELRPLEPHELGHGVWSSADKEMGRAQRADAQFGIKIEKSKKWTETLQEAPNRALQLRGELPREIHDLSISVGERTITLGAEEVRAERAKLTEEDTKDLARIEELSVEMQAIQDEPDGLFGRRVRDKQDRFKPLMEENRKLTEQRQRRETEMRKLSNKYRSYEKQVHEAIEPYQDLLVKHGFTAGTVSELLTALREAAHEEMQSAEADKAAVIEERKGSADALATLEEERKALEEELVSIEDDVRSKESHRDSLKEEIQKAGYRVAL